jgi:hypothetical protein
VVAIRGLELELNLMHLLSSDLHPNKVCHDIVYGSNCLYVVIYNVSMINTPKSSRLPAPKCDVSGTIPSQIYPRAWDIGTASAVECFVFRLPHLEHIPACIGDHLAARAAQACAPRPARASGTASARERFE